MRHRKKGAKLGRVSDHRKALLRNLATSLALHGHVRTTTAKARALVSFYEPLITRARRLDSREAIRLMKATLNTELAQRSFLNRLNGIREKSGYLRMTKIGFRDGDRAEMAIVQYVSAE